MLRLEKTRCLTPEILSSLHDSGEFSLLNGENNLNGINLPRLWLLFFRIGETYRVTLWSYDNSNHHRVPKENPLEEEKKRYKGKYPFKKNGKQQAAKLAPIY